MATDKTIEAPTEDVALLKKQLTEVAATLRKVQVEIKDLRETDERHSENWKRACARFMDGTAGGKL